ncbi:MAG: alpha/beta hydrolase [Sphingobium sp.]
MPARSALFSRLCLLALCWGSQAAAVTDDISRYPTVQHPERYAVDWAGFYPLAIARTRETQRRLPHQLDIAYGPDARQRLDIYRPVKSDGAAPVLIFFHGGGFLEGDRSIYGFVARSFAERGIVTIVASYRLVSDGFTYPAASDDARAVVKWAYGHVGEQGGDPGALFLAGHSAGALLVAEIGADRSWMARENLPADALRGVIAISEGYNLVQSKRYPGYAPSLLTRYAFSPVLHVANPAPHFIVAAGGAEKTETFEAPSRVFADVLRANGAEVTTLFPAGQDHRAIVEDFASPTGALFQKAAALIGAKHGAPN